MGQESSKETRLKQVAKELNVGVSTLVEFLNKKGFQVENNPNHRISAKAYDILAKEFSSDVMAKKQMEKQAEMEKERKKAISAENKAKKQNDKNNANNNQVPNDKKEIKVIGKIDLEQKNKNVIKSDNNPKPQKQEQNPKNQNQNQNQNQNRQQQKPQNNSLPEQGFKVLGKIDLDSINAKVRPDKKSRQEREKQFKDANRQAQKPVQESVNVNVPQQVQEVKPAENIDNAPIKDEVLKEEIFHPNNTKLPGPTVVGMIDKNKLDSLDDSKKSKRKRKRKRATNGWR